MAKKRGGTKLKIAGKVPKKSVENNHSKKNILNLNKKLKKAKGSKKTQVEKPKKGVKGKAVAKNVARAKVKAKAKVDKNIIETYSFKSGKIPITINIEPISPFNQSFISLKKKCCL